MNISELRVSVYDKLAACLQQCSHSDGDDPGEPWWVVMAKTCTDLDITRQEQKDIGKVYIPFNHRSIQSYSNAHCHFQINKSANKEYMTIGVTNN